MTNVNGPGFGTATDTGRNISLDHIVARWIQSRFQWSGASAARLKLEDLEIYIDWSKVDISHGSVEYKDRESSKPRSAHPTNQVLFRTNFSNNTHRAQEYTFRSAQVTRQTIDVFFRGGFKCSTHPELVLRVPQDVAECGGSVSKELTVEYGKDETKEEEVTWSVDSNVRVKPFNHTEATINLVEREFDKIFTFESRVMGHVTVTLYRRWAKRLFHHVIKEDVVDVIKVFMNEGWMPENFPGFEIKSEEGVLYAAMNVKGRLKFHLGVEQNVLLDEKSIS
jgi:hypothetical protein